MKDVSRFQLLCAIICAASVARVGTAQEALGALTLSGRVVRARDGAPIAGADVWLISNQERVATDKAGSFHFAGLMAGPQLLQIRHLGYEVRRDTVTVSAGADSVFRFVLREQSAQLDTMRTVAGQQKYLSPMLRDFEERRRQGFGHFITDEELRKDESRDMANIIIGHLPGLARFRVPSDGQGGHGQTYIGTSRKCGDGPAFLSCRSGGSYCPVTLYVDGVVVFNSANNKSTADIPDLALFRATDYAGIEYYAGGASMPTKFNFTSSGCGVLLLWSRER